MKTRNPIFLKLLILSQYIDKKLLQLSIFPKFENFSKKKWFQEIFVMPQYIKRQKFQFFRTF
jgi:hypothetical protein